MKIRIDVKSVSDPTPETSETTLAQFLAADDGIGAEDAERITRELNATGRSRVNGFVGVYADITRIG